MAKTEVEVSLDSKGQAVAAILITLCVSIVSLAGMTVSILWVESLMDNGWWMLPALIVVVAVGFVAVSAIIVSVSIIAEAIRVLFKRSE